MTTVELILRIIWLLIGLVGWFFTYHTIRKYWYDLYQEDCWKSQSKIVLIVMYICFPLWIFGGIFSILYWMLLYNRKYWTLYFKIPTK